MEKTLKEYIDDIHRKPYNVLTNNCMHQCFRLEKQAQRLGCSTELIFCLARTPGLLRFIYPLSPHFFVEIDGDKVDQFYARWWGPERKTVGRIIVRRKIKNDIAKC